MERDIPRANRWIPSGSLNSQADHSTPGVIMTKVSQANDTIIFVNYRRTDTGWAADHLADKLKNTFGQDRVFLDVRGSDVGDDFTEKIKEKLRSTTILLVIIGKNWLSASDKFCRRRLDHPGDWVRREIRSALQKKDCKVIPVLIDDTELPNEPDALPEDISELLTRNQIGVRQTNSEDDIEALIKDIEKAGFHRLADHNKQDLIVLRSGSCEIGPLTLSAILKAPADQERLDAYPTGLAGPHLVFDLYNPNPVDFAVHAIEAEIVSYQPIDLEILSHGVGATDVKRRFQVRVQPELGRYRAIYVGRERPAEYVKIEAGKSELFDVEITTMSEGLYKVCVHVVGTLAGNRFDVPIEATQRSIVFFDRESNYRVDRGQKYISYSEYIMEMSKYDSDLSRY